MRRLAAALLATTLLLTGCGGGSDTPDAPDASQAPATNAFDGITVEGELGAAPTVTFDQPFTVTALGPEMKSSGFVEDDVELAGTGFEGHGSTGWVTINAPAVPGETLTFALAIMDMGDSNKATVAVVENWHWSCAGCVPAEVDPECGKEGHPDCCGVCVAPADDPQCNTEGHPMCCIPN